MIAVTGTGVGDTQFRRGFRQRGGQFAKQARDTAPGLGRQGLDRRAMQHRNRDAVALQFGAASSTRMAMKADEITSASDPSRISLARLSSKR